MMKIIFTVLAVFLIFLPAEAQIENIKIAGDSTIVINNAYAGILAGSCFSQDSLNLSKSVNVRIGFQGTYSPTRWLSVISREVYQIDDQKNVSAASLFWTKVNLKSLTMETGFTPTLATESRPIAVSAEGQFEAWAESNIPGAALGAKIKYQFRGNNYVGIGIAKRENRPEYHLRFSSPNFKASIYYSAFDKKFGSTATVETKRLYNIMSFNSGKNLGNYAVFNLSRRNKIDCYLDAGYGFKETKIIKAETGLLKRFSGEYVKGVFGLGYCYETRTINGIFFIHI